MATRLDSLKELQQIIAGMPGPAVLPPGPPRRRRTLPEVQRSMIDAGITSQDGQSTLANPDGGWVLTDQYLGLPQANPIPATGRDRFGPMPGGIHAATGATVQEREAVSNPELAVATPGVPTESAFFSGSPWDLLRKDLGGGDAAPGAAPTPVFSMPDPKADEYVPFIPAAAPGAPAAPGATPAVEADPYQAKIDWLTKYLVQPNQANPYQDKADAFAEREQARTALLAQLAFAAGLTKSGGVGWEGVAEGFAGAAKAHDAGFERYANALQDSADRFSDKQNRDENRRLAIAKAGIDLVEAEKDRDAKTWQDQLDSIDTRFGKEMDAAKSDLGTDPAILAEIQRRWQIARQIGAYVQTDDVRDQ